MDSIFIHIPKNAGSSIKKTLPISCLTHRHAAAKKVIELYSYFEKDFFSKRFSFAIVRNPWCRMVSTFYFNKNQWITKTKSDPRLLKSPIAKFCLSNDFRGFVKWWVNQPLNKQLDHLGRSSCLAEARSGVRENSQQIDWLTDDADKIIVDFVGRFERIRQDHRKIMAKLQLNKPERRLPHINHTKHKKYPHYYDGPTRKIVAKAYAKDIEIFRYRFGK
jgi:hypothetical protein